MVDVPLLWKTLIKMCRPKQTFFFTQDSKNDITSFGVVVESTLYTISQKCTFRFNSLRSWRYNQNRGPGQKIFFTSGSAAKL